MSRSFIFSSNSERLSWRDWIIVVIIFAGTLFTFPRIWPTLEKFNPPPDYRLPYQLSDDYWLFTRWSQHACSNFPVLIIGDSVIWGQYVTLEQTLSGHLNGLEGDPVFANMGVDGLHPAGMAGLLEYYGKDISNKAVILHLNPLWMSSKKHDLRGKEEFRFNHPGLIPQFIHDLACYRPSFSERMEIVAERSLSFFGWVKHIRGVYFENMDIQNWTIQNPYCNPLDAITLGVPLPENRPKSKAVPWTERKMKVQNFPWMEPEESFQWRAFRTAIEILRTRNNTVFIVLGPFNPYILSKKSLGRYNRMKGKIEAWLNERGIEYNSVPDLSSENYADASHPLKEGYARIAEGLFETDSFRRWVEKLRGQL